MTSARIRLSVPQAIYQEKKVSVEDDTVNPRSQLAAPQTSEQMENVVISAPRDSDPDLQAHRKKSGTAPPPTLMWCLFWLNSSAVTPVRTFPLSSKGMQARLALLTPRRNWTNGGGRVNQLLKNRLDSSDELFFDCMSTRDTLKDKPAL